MTLVHQVLSPSDLETVYEFASKRLVVEIPDSTERQFASWTAKWRRESLEHYLKLGWSFIVREGSHTGPTRGFFLGQPLLFFRGQTQSLWVEHLDGETPEAIASLVDVAVRVGREKHLQRVLFAEADKHKDYLKAWNPTFLHSDLTGAAEASPTEHERIAIVRTTKG